MEVKSDFKYEVKNQKVDGLYYSYFCVLLVWDCLYALFFSNWGHLEDALNISTWLLGQMTVCNVSLYHINAHCFEMKCWKITNGH